MISRFVAIAALCIIASACARSDVNLYGGVFGQQITGNEHSVIISNVWNEMDAFPVAEQHCKKFSKAAKFQHFGDHKAAFECV